MEEWELYRLSSISASKAVSRLLQKRLYGSAAFHAQQELEMLVKACICKYGFNSYLRTKIVADKEFLARFEIDPAQRRAPLLTHMPSGLVLILSLDFVNYQLRKIGKKET